MIQVEPCKGCGRPLFDHRVANLDVRCETEGVDAQEAVAALVAGRSLWRATATGLAPARPAELSALRTAEPGERPHIVTEHRCTAHQRPATPTPRQSPQPTPQSPPAGRTAPFSGPSAGPSSVRSAEPHRSDPTCDLCGSPCRPGTYWGIEHAGRWVNVEHEACP